jgi:plastocyanin
LRHWLLVLAVACSACEQAPRRHEVSIRNFAFVPDTVRVAAGDTVVFSNGDFAPHTATAVSKAWDSGPIDANKAWSGTAFSRGTHDYICTLHPNMKGVIVVN